MGEAYPRGLALTSMNPEVNQIAEGGHRIRQDSGNVGIH